MYGSGTARIIKETIKTPKHWQLLCMRKWAVPVLGVAAFGASVYAVWELPRMVPRTIGRRIRASLLLKDAEDRPESGFVDVQAARTSRETRKVLRLAGWDLTEKHTVALDQRAHEVKVVEERLKNSEGAATFLRDMHERTGEVKEAARLIVEKA